MRIKVTGKLVDWLTGRGVKELKVTGKLVDWLTGRGGKGIKSDWKTG